MFRRFEFRALLRRIDELDEAVPAAEQDVGVDRGAASSRSTSRASPRSWPERRRQASHGSSDGRYAVATGGRVALAAIAPEQLARLLTPLETTAHDFKAEAGELAAYGVEPAFDATIAAYLLDPGRADYRVDDLLEEQALDLTIGAVRGRSRRDPRGRIGRRPALGARAAAGGPRDGRCPPAHRASARSGALRDGARRTSRSTRRRWARSPPRSPSTARSSSPGRTSWPDPSSRSAAPSSSARCCSSGSACPAGRKGKTGYSTDQRVLSRIRELHPIVPVIEEWRELSKLLSTYLVPFPELIGDDGRLHTTFSQTTAATGRLSANRPNLQNIPVRTEVGRQIRETFIAPDGSRLVSADYSQVELRILANLSGEELLLRRVRARRRHPRGDGGGGAREGPGRAHDATSGTARRPSTSASSTASRASGCPTSSTSPARRRSRTSTPTADACRRVAEWIARAIEEARERGYSVTMLGRRRPIPELRAGNWQVRSLGERLAVNSVIQGTAADIIKLAMIRVHRRLRDEGRAGQARPADPRRAAARGARGRGPCGHAARARGDDRRVPARSSARRRRRRGARLAVRQVVNSQSLRLQRHSSNFLLSLHSGSSKGRRDRRLRPSTPERNPPTDAPDQRRDHRRRARSLARGRWQAHPRLRRDAQGVRRGGCRHGHGRSRRPR